MDIEPESDEPVGVAKQWSRDIEQFRDKAYYDPKGKKWTYGYGFTFRPDDTPVQQGDTVNLEDSENRLDAYYQKNLKYINTLPAAKFMNNRHKAALLDLFYNIGTGLTPEKNKSLLEAVGSEEGLKNLPKVIRMYNKAGVKEVASLTNRREIAAKWIESYGASKPVREDPVAPSRKETPVVPTSQPSKMSVTGKPRGAAIDLYGYDPVYGIRKLPNGSIVSDTRPSER